MADFTHMSDEQVVAFAIACRVQAEDAEGEAGTDPRWGEADAYAALYDASRGWRQPQIAEACGISQKTVSRRIRTSSQYCLDAPRPLFAKAYKEQWFTDTTPHQRMGRRPALDASQVTEARNRVSAGESVRAVAIDIGVDPRTLQKALALAVPTEGQTAKEKAQAVRARQSAVSAVSSEINSIRAFASIYLLGQGKSDPGVLDSYGDSVIVEALGQHPELKEHLDAYKRFMADVVRLYGASQIHVLTDEEVA